MSEFQFAKSQRVIVPVNLALAEGVQGVVTGNAVHLGREPQYEIQWPSAGTLGERGMLLMLSGSVSESELLVAQPPKMVSAEEATQRYLDGLAEGNNSVVAERDALQAQVIRLERAAQRRRKASRAASRKRR